MKTIRKFNYNEIKQIYSKYVQKTPEYFKKYDNTLERINELKQDFENDKRNIVEKDIIERSDAPRIFTLLDFKEWVVKHKINPINKLLITSNDRELIYLDPKYVKHISYNQDPYNNDLHNLFLEERDFDFVIFCQTLEHLYNPWLGLSNISNHIKKGGYVFTSAPTLNIPHLMPAHYYGFTPMGLATMCLSVGLEPVETGQFGNKDYINYIYEKQDWPTYHKLIDKNGCIKNEEGCDSMVWILAKKL